MIKKLRGASSLRVKSLYAILSALVCAVLVWLGVRGLCGLYVENYYMSDDAVAQRKSDIYSDFSSYVTRNALSGRDSAAVAQYTDVNKYVTILVYSGSSLNMRVENGMVKNARAMEDYELSMYANQYGSLYPLRFSDGLYQIAIGDSSQDGVYSLWSVIGILAAALCFVVIMCFYMSSLSTRIISLSRQALTVGGGELERCISIPGSDEISQLAGEMDNMRRSLIKRMDDESRAWQANSELITAISHDIRTPMTSMIGYLGLLNSSSMEDKEHCRQFASAAYDKAMELKDLTDELFKYFLVFGRSEPDIDMEIFDGHLLIEQLISEAEFELKEAGFKVQRIEAEAEFNIKVDPLYLKRVFDNMISNVKKYADKEKVVMIIAEQRCESVSVCISNYISRSMDRVESTRIGLRTCDKIMKHMGGSFKTDSDEQHFAAEFELPIA